MVSFPAIKNTFRRAVPLSNILNKNTRKDSAFGNGRILWVHNPFGSDFGKARDPYINLLTLARLSHSPDPRVRRAAAHNLSKRLKTDIQREGHEYFCRSFDPGVLVRALRMTTGYEVNKFEDALFNSLNSQPFEKHYRQLLIQFVVQSVKPLVSLKYLLPNITTGELDQILAGKPCKDIRLLMADHPLISRNALLSMANDRPSLAYQSLIRHTNKFPARGYYDDRLNLRAYFHLLPEMTPQELDILAESQSRAILERVLSHQKTAQTTAEKARINITKLNERTDVAKKQASD